jgi:hypothetical protein
MAFYETTLFYLLIGLAVAVAVATYGDHSGRGQRTFQTATAVLFWPLYVPILLSGAPVQPEESAEPTAPHATPRDAMSMAIAQVEAELDAALQNLDGWAEEALAREQDRIAELRAAWRSQAGRIREIDRLLATQEVGPRTTCEPFSDDRAANSEEARRQNLLRLSQVRNQAHDDLTATLASVRELVSMIHLAKFTGAPASRAEELITQIAATVEGLSEVATWGEPVHA